MTRVRRPRGLLWLLLAAALFMRALVPQGYMAERDAAGTITLRVCGSDQAVQIPLGGGEAPESGDSAQPPCAFAGLGTPALPPPHVGDLPLPAPDERLYGGSEPETPRVTAPLPHPPARGPPLTA